MMRDARLSGSCVTGTIAYVPETPFNLEKEYYSLFDAVNRFDERVIVVKGWSVTLSLAALAWGFQFAHFGLFLVACISGVGFWIVDAQMKRHYMRYYARMREIEVFCAGQTASPTSLSTPQIDWSWERALHYFRGSRPSTPAWYPDAHRYDSYRWSWVFGHVCLPHVISAVAGLVLFLLALGGRFGPISW
jgi:uncharacterized membrane protein